MKNPLKFIQEVKQEAFKVSWPTGKETLQGTLMVVAMAIIASIFFLLLFFLIHLILQARHFDDFLSNSLFCHLSILLPLHIFLQS